MYKLDDRCHPPLTEEQETRYPVLDLKFKDRKWNFLWFCLVERSILSFLFFYSTLTVALAISTVLTILYLPREYHTTIFASYIGFYMLVGVAYVVLSFCLKSHILYREERYTIKDQGFHHLIIPKEPCVIHIVERGRDRKYIFPPEEIV